MVVGHVGNLRIENRCAEWRLRTVFGDRFLMLFRSYVVEDGKSLAERLCTRIQNSAAASVGIHPVIPLVGHPERLVDIGGKRIGFGKKLVSLSLLAEHLRHLPDSAERGGIHHVGAHRLALRDVYGLHPFRMALLAPVYKRGLTLHESAFTHHRLLILLQRTEGDRIYLLEPFAVSRHFINLISGKRPHQAVGRDGPRPARTGILDDLPARVNLLHQRNHRSFRLHVSHGEDDGIAHIAGPHSRPLLTCAQGGIRLHGIHHLVERHVIQSLMQEVVRLQFRIGREVVFPLPALVDRHIITRASLICRLEFIGTYSPCLEFILKNGVTRPAVSLGLDNHRVRGKSIRRKSQRRHSHQISISFHKLL